MGNGHPDEVWAISKASRLKAVLSWTKTIWVMVRSTREPWKSTWKGMRWSTRVRTRRKIKELITIWVSSILRAPPLKSLTPDLKLIQVINTAIKHANKNFLSRLGGFSLHFSLGVEGWLWIGWVVGFGWFECFLLFVVVGARNELRSTLLTLILTSFKPNL
jgi:hypothetical protein